jgi:FixJ family two-component response regulator
VKVIMLTTFDLDEYVHEALRAGAVGFLLNDTAPRDLTEAVRTVAAGNAMLSPTVTRRLIRTFAGRGITQADAARARLARLTERELEVVCAVGRGLSNAEIGRDLDMAEATVKAHVSRALASSTRPIGCRRPSSPMTPALSDRRLTYRSHICRRWARVSYRRAPAAVGNMPPLRLRGR